MLQVDISHLFPLMNHDAFSSYALERYDVLDKVRAGMAEYAGALGWLDIEKWAGRERLDQLSEMAAKVRADADAFVIIGVGGSNNAARAAIEALKTPGNPEIYYFGNSVSAEPIASLMTKFEGKSVYVNIIAKNFETLEPGVGFRIMRKYIRGRYGSAYASRVFATGTQGSHLDQLCQDNGYTFLSFPDDVGGRFSALCDVGLFPMAVAGLDIHSLIDGAMEVSDALSESDGLENPAFAYATVRNFLHGRGYRTELLGVFEPRLSCFVKWWIQLFAESEGKDKKGLFPVSSVYSEDLHSVGQFVQDGADGLFETFLHVMDSGHHFVLENDGVADHFDYLDGMDVDDICRIAYDATLRAHADRRPCLTIHLDRLDSHTFGQLFYFFEYACYLSSLMLGVNPFDQPGVEAYKTNIFKALGK